MPSSKRAVDFQRVFEASQENYVLLAADEPDFTILAASDGYLYMSGMAREELVGRKVFEVFPENPEQPEGAPISEIRASLKRVMEEKEVHFLALHDFVWVTLPAPSTSG
ncbi:MAG: PAS domain-containing protein, partial [Thiohalorhabdus sp.]|uniref:PAS domain-containing protein n=1 Tax=Thiohalorhabdus sp. TaxID=3094134 RepID=UPI00397F5B1D